MGFYSVFFKKAILPCVTLWMNLEDVMLSEISQTWDDKCCIISLWEWSWIVKLAGAESRVVVDRDKRKQTWGGIGQRILILWWCMPVISAMQEAETEDQSSRSAPVKCLETHLNRKKLGMVVHACCPNYRGTLSSVLGINWDLISKITSTKRAGVMAQMPA
jgi:hypothetical protein